MHDHKHHCEHCEGRHQNGGDSMMLGVILGGILGAAAALLLTPNDGDKNREIAKLRGKEFLDKAGKKFSELRADKLDPMMEDLIDEVDQRFNDVKSEVRTRVNSSPAARKVKKQVRKVVRKAKKVNP